MQKKPVINKEQEEAQTEALTEAQTEAEEHVNAINII